MNRQNLNCYAKWAVAPMFVFLTAAASVGAVLFEDGFTSQSQSNQNWLKSEDMTATVSDGSCELKTTTQYLGEYLRPLSSKPSTFTITYTLKSQTSVTTNKAGVLFCKQPDSYNGYFLTVQGDMLVLYNMVQGANGISWSFLYQKQSFDINSSNNKVTVSKSGSRMVFFANDEYVGEFTDNTYSSGDVSLFLSGNMTVVFGPVRVTDEFTDGGPRTYFSDNFDSGRSKYWEYLNPEPGISDGNGVLSVNTAAGGQSYMYVSMPITDFIARVDVRHVSGGTTINDLYGIALYGIPPSGGAVNMMLFAITGGRRYTVFKSGAERPDPVLDIAIRGASGDVTEIYIDTLEVSKKIGSSTYEFAVNGQPLSVNYPVADFQVTGIGIFTYANSAMAITFDNFEAKKDVQTSVRFDRNQPQTLRRGGVVKSVDPVFYDLRGRKRYVSNPQAAGRASSMRASGVYVNKNGREVLSDKNRRARVK